MLEKFECVIGCLCSFWNCWKSAYRQKNLNVTKYKRLVLWKVYHILINLYWPYKHFKIGKVLPLFRYRHSIQQSSVYIPDRGASSLGACFHTMLWMEPGTASFSGRSSTGMALDPGGTYTTCWSVEGNTAPLQSASGNGAYVCDIIIKPGSYAEMLLSGKKLFGLDSPHMQTERSNLIILNYIQWH